MRVRSVTIQGFKSFGEKVRLEFHPKINAVIGPNGSGKSNVIEGIRWASHTARTRELRVRESTELIFHGSIGKAPLGMAEVELELEQFEGANLNIARRTHRTGWLVPKSSSGLFQSTCFFLLSFVEWGRESGATVDSIRPQTWPFTSPSDSFLKKTSSLKSRTYFV